MHFPISVCSKTIPECTFLENFSPFEFLYWNLEILIKIEYSLFDGAQKEKKKEKNSIHFLFFFLPPPSLKLPPDNTEIQGLTTSVCTLHEFE